MKNKLKYIIPIVVFVIIIFAIYSLLFGKLFPYSPVIIGFSANETTNAVIYIQNGAKFNDFDKVNSFIPPIEEFFNLRYRDKPRIFIFKDKQNYFQRSMAKARFCSFYNGDIVIAPWALEEANRGELSLEIYLTHELTHSLIHQQSNLIMATKFPKWLHEGTAMYFANQMGTTLYPSKQDTYQYIRNGNFLHPKYYQTKQGKRIKLYTENRIGFIYSEFACIVDALIDQYGKDKFILYIKTLIKNKNHDRIFKNVYGIEFNVFIENFKKIVVTKNTTA